ncbi:MAG: beta-ketoacyl-ACP synthase II [Caldilineaceae bacterium]|nr:beta-ketoacyl-ACP synthase II [Caldilineaceae bacterium]MCB0122792.1 beta-ketoacyl-ACP synthase II [Caldilineaceae bacterium]
MSATLPLKRVVVTGLGALTPVGNDLQSSWSNLLQGRSGAAPITRFDPSPFKTHFACEVKNFEPTDHLDRKEVRRTDRFSQYALVVSGKALADAALDPATVDTTRVGVIWASAMGGIETTEEQLQKYDAAPDNPRFSPLYIPKMLLDASSGTISMHFGLRGVNHNTVSACASSNAALIDALYHIRLGKADAIVCGGSEAAITPSSLGGFSSAQALSTRNGDPATASRPFDVERDGFVLGEGAAALILEEYEYAKRRGARIYAELVGGGSSGDAYHATAAHPEGDGALRSMLAALDDATLSPSQVDYVNPHATSTPVGDVSELKAMQRLFGEALAGVQISATKSMTGHLLGAAGAIEAVIAVLTIHTGQVPPTINTTQLDPLVPEDLQLTLGKQIERTVDVAMSNSFGFGGHNSTVIFQRVAE